MKEIPPPLPELHNSFFVLNQFGERVSFGRKLVFWLLLGLLSVILAEVTCASSPYPFFDGWGLLVVTPLYTLHTLFLAGLIYQRKSVSLPVLLLAGMLFGLYEALITKVIWDPTWGDKASMAGGVAWLQTSVLVFFWHPWFAFIFPLLFGEVLFWASDEVSAALPAFMQKKAKWLWPMLLAALCGVNQGANTASIHSALLSTLEALGVFLLFSGLWKIVSKCQPLSMRNLLPKGRELVWIGILLGLLYALSIPLIRPESLPRSAGPYLIIGGIYLFTILVLYSNLKKVNVAIPVIQPTARRFPWVKLGLFVLVYLVFAALSMQFKPAAHVVVIASWVFGLYIAQDLIRRALVNALREAAKLD